MWEGQRMDYPGSSYRVMAAWYRLLERLPTWLGLMLCAALISAVLTAFALLRSGGAIWRYVIPCWAAMFVGGYLGMVALAILKGYPLAEPPDRNWGKE